ncbi:hypothetical protein HXX76_013519 [Chlamydomonas incerta]|uniref:Uncharacterized protein n=1 Tax=Chlamydomonas incerta TaxID=51695 RepID=A0A835SEA0_CHLIN|nr:hypothetical protein HXX76_013519 [Chlamydomonas incerta]|eukprot:KAG2425677.1 hypothetical protein HXX76_013519 [Chlamydomonas incerta]
MADSSSSSLRPLAAARAAVVLLVVVAAASAAASGAGGRRALLQQGGSPAVPPQCIQTGLALQNSCNKELEIASKAFGLAPNTDVSNIKVDSAKLQQYLGTAPPPGKPCCDATVAFNNAYCSCSPPVLDLVKSFTNNDVAQYREVAKYLEKRCKAVGSPFTLYMDGTCPPNKKPKSPAALTAMPRKCRFEADGDAAAAGGSGVAAAGAAVLPSAASSSGLACRISRKNTPHPGKRAPGLGAAAAGGSGLLGGGGGGRWRLRTGAAAVTLLVVAASLGLIHATNTPARRLGANARAAVSAADDMAALPSECISAGMDLQTQCADEMSYASDALGIDPSAATSPGAVQLSDSQLSAFLDKADAPSVKCCKFCSCSPAMLDLIKSFTNNDVQQYYILSKYFERTCATVGQPYKLYFGSTCPATGSSAATAKK